MFGGPLGWVLHWPGGREMGSLCRCFSSPSAVCLGLWAAGGASASPPLLGFSQWRPVLECTLVVLMMGRKSGTAYVTVLVTSLVLNILIIYEQGDLHFHFALGPTNDVANHG